VRPSRSQQTPSGRLANSLAKPVRSGTLLRRKEFLGIVYQLISDHGMDGVSMRQIADACDVSTGTINYHFGNKRALIIGAMEAAYELPVDWEEYKGSPSLCLRRLALSFVWRSASDRWWRFFISYTALGLRDDEMRTHQYRRFCRQQNFWSQLIADAVRVGEFRRGIDSAFMAERLLLLGHGLVLKQSLNSDEGARHDARQEIESFFANFLEVPKRRPKRSRPYTRRRPQALR